MDRAAGAWITRQMYEECEVGQQSHAAQAGFRYAGFCDIGLVRDATAIAVCHLEGGRGDERVILDSMHTLRGTRSAPVELEAVEDLVTELTRRFGVRHWIFEAPQAVASVQRLQNRLVRCKVEARYPTADTQATLFGTLYRLFAARRLVLYPHLELKRETLNLVTKTVSGRLKVVDSASIHQDHVIALGGAADLLVGNVPGRRALETSKQLLEWDSTRPTSATSQLREQHLLAMQEAANGSQDEGHEDVPVQQPATASHVVRIGGAGSADMSIQVVREPVSPAPGCRHQQMTRSLPDGVWVCDTCGQPAQPLSGPSW